MREGFTAPEPLFLLSLDLSTAAFMAVSTQVGTLDFTATLAGTGGAGEDGAADGDSALASGGLIGPATHI
jgi:hypothetical protein